MLNEIRQKTTNLRHLVRRYVVAKDGVAAIEFVFVAPIMIFMYFGLAEISMAVAADRKISHATNVAGDLSTQVATITADEMSEIMTAAVMVMGVPSAKLGEVTIEIASYSKDSAGVLVESGKATLGDDPYPDTFDADALDPLILSEASGVVVARVAYEYEPLKLKYMKTNYTMKETFLLKPRKSASVRFTDADDEIADFTCTLSGTTASCS